MLAEIVETRVEQATNADESRSMHVHWTTMQIMYEEPLYPMLGKPCVPNQPPFLIEIPIRGGCSKVMHAKDVRALHTKPQGYL